MSDISADIYTKQQPNSLIENVQGAIQARGGMLQNQLLGTENQQKSLELLASKQGAFNNMLGALIGDPNLNYERVMAEGQRAVDLGFFSPDILKTEAAMFKPGDPPEKIRQGLTTILNRSASSMDLLNRYNGAPTAVNTGPATVFGTQGVNGFQPSSTLGNAMSPGEAATPVTLTTPTGQGLTTTKGNIPQLLGGAAAAGSAEGAGSIPPAGTAPSAPSPGGMLSPSPQQQKMFEASAEQFANAKASAANYQTEILPLHKMLDLLPKTTTGIGAEGVQNLNRLLSTFGVSIAGSGQQAANYSEVEKYATQLARSAGAAPNSDQQLQAAFAANPGTATDNAAAQKVVKTLLTYRRMQQAMTLNAVNSGVPPEGYADYITKAGANADPRAFGFDLMTPAAKAQLGTELDKDKAARAKFLASYKIAQQAGVLGQ